MNYKEHEILFESRQAENENDLFKVSEWALEYFPNGLEFLKQYYKGQLDLLAKGYEIEGFSFLTKAIREWKEGLLLFQAGIRFQNSQNIKEATLVIENTIRMLCYSLGNFSNITEQLSEQNDFLAMSFELSSEYSYWIFNDYYFEKNK
jgi:hypothetical protein